MQYDLVIKNGAVADGSGMPRYRADVGVRHGRVAALGRIRERAREVLDADGQVVASGFIDGHTHMDAQVFWDPLGTCSCRHGIASVVMGNCGFTLAPCASSEKHLVMRNLERAEDIAADAMNAGIDWKWTTFPEFLDCVDALPKGINDACYIGHSALRAYVMGERAFEQPATDDDIRAMEREVRDLSAPGRGVHSCEICEATRPDASGTQDAGRGGAAMDVSSILKVKGARVETIASDATLATAAAALVRKRIGALVVSEDGERADGVISERDIVRGLTEHGVQLLDMRVSDLMTRSVFTCRPDDSVESVMATMTEHRVRHVPVVQGGALVGIVSIGDVVKHRLDELEAETTVLRDFIMRQ